jgi:outer membrane protein TolC
VLQQLAIERRPDLAAIGARVREEQANVALAAREFYPDIEVFGRYDAFWQETPLRPMVGMNLNLPIQRERRRAAVCEAMFRANQRRAEFEQQIDAIRNDVQAAWARLVESRQIVALYRQTLLPAAEQNVASARSGYVAARVDFLRLIEAQRQLITLREKSYEAETDYHRRLAELERLVGGPLPEQAPVGEEVPPPRAVN